MLNTTECLSRESNTGYGACPLTPGAIRGAFRVPKNRRFTPLETQSAETLYQALLAGISAAPALRIYPMGKTFNFTGNTEDVTIQTGTSGEKAIVREGDYDWTIQFREGGLCLLKALRKLNGGTHYFIFFDTEGVVYGQTIGNDLAGIPVLFYAAPFTPNDGSNIAVFASRFIFSAFYLNDNVGFVPANRGQLESLTGLQNIILKLQAPRAAGVIQIKTLAGCSGYDLTQDYSVELAAAALYTVTRVETGNPVTVTSVAYNAGIKGFTITLDVTDPDYLANGTYIVALAGAVQLAAAGIDGYDGTSLVVA